MVQPTSEPCFDFTADGVKREKKTVIISPIRIEEYDRKKVKVTYGCSRGIFCRDSECRYVKRPKIEAKDEPIMGVETFYTYG
jgi:hypothetical protein